jgi:diguanylate cyclase (GGDEF)-like protein
MLRDLQALQGVGDEILDALLPRARLARLKSGERLLLRGAPNLCVYVVISGLLRVELDDGNPPLARLGPGETVGELSLLSGSVTTATVAAEEPTQLLALDEATFWWLAESSHAFSVGLLIRLAKRMRSSTDAVQTHIALRRQFEQAALSDALTGLPNRRWLDQMLPRIVQRHIHGSLPFGIGIMDIDHFKDINDTFGHPAGDAVLMRIAQIAHANLRPTDFAARMGGEEFALIFPNTDLAGAVGAAERLREAIGSAAFDHDGRRLSRVTVSIGLVALGPGEDFRGVLAQADQALYGAKQSGRNRTFWPGCDASKAGTS